MHEHHLTQDEIETMSANDAAKYLAASDDLKTAMASEYRAAKGPKPVVGRSSKLRTMGMLAFFGGSAVALYIGLFPVTDPYSDPTPIAYSVLATTVASFGFFALLAGILEERLFDIHEAI